MSSIFNLLSGLNESDRGQIKPIARSKTSHEIRPNSLKTMGVTKPKGLSIRSNSDMNISDIHSIKKNVIGKEQDCLKLKVTQVDSNGCPISPGKATSTKKSSKTKESNLKEETMTIKCTKKQSNDGVFKKPLPPNKNVKRYPEPEKLAYWYDSQHDFDYGYIEAVEKEFKDMLSKKKENLKHCKENVLISNSDASLLEIPKLIFDKSYDKGYEELVTPDLPEISDI
ncbi:hypothetical protein P5V15_005217 [Pogonomyrmex californicus]